MANRERGEVDLVAGDKTYTLALTTNGACAVEAASGKLFDEICAGVQKYSIRDMRWLIWGSLQEYHADEVKTPNDAGRIIDACGGLAKVWATATGFLTANADTSTDLAGPGGTPDEVDPPPAQARNGTGSTLTPGASV